MKKGFENINPNNYTDIPNTLVEVLRWRAIHTPEKIAFTFLQGGKGKKSTLTYSELDRRACALAAYLQDQGYEKERALLLYPPGLDYLVGFFGCLYAGVVAVPAYPPNPSRLEQTLPRIEAIIENAEPKLILTSSDIMSVMKVVNLHLKFKESVAKIPLLDKYSHTKKKSSSFSHLRQLTWFAPDSEVLRSASEWKFPDINSNSLVFLQYTSGSTGVPKGVMLTHENLLHNSYLIRSTFGLNEDDEGVIWLPFYHDMGLIGGILQPIYSGLHVTLMSPLMFLASPFRWLQTISNVKDKQVVSGGPNFAYDLCVKKVKEEQVDQLDLRNWRLAFSGAEPVRSETIELFSRKFNRCGFVKEKFYPCYGLAEATLLVTGRHPNHQLNFTEQDTVSSTEKNLSAKQTKKKHKKVLVSCGQIVDEQKVYIVDPEKFTLCPPKETGEIWVKGVSIAQGYWRNREETENIFQAYTSDTLEGPCLRTGDLGFIDGGELYVTGRLKDLIIIRGKNHYPQDIEFTTESSHPSLRQGCVAAFSIDVDNEERLVVVQEVRPGKHFDYLEITNAILQQIVETHELQPYAIVLIKAKTISKTSSGKIQRRTTKAQYLSGKLTILKETKFINEERTEENTTALSVKKEQDLLDRIRENPDRADIRLWLALQLAQILNIDADTISFEKSLMGYGLDSLMIVELKNDIESVLEIDIPINKFFECANLQQFVDVLQKLIISGPESERVSVELATEKSPQSPLSYGQRSLWFLHQLLPDSPAFNVPFAVKIVSELDIEILKKTFQVIIEHHPSLKTIYPKNNNEPFQLIQEQAELDFVETDTADWSDEQLEMAVQEEAHNPFNLETGPLMRIRIYRKSDSENVILAVFHHIAIDLWSVVVLMNDLVDIYSHLIKENRTPELNHNIQYTDFVNWQSKYIKSGNSEKSLEYWKKKLAGDISPLNLPIDKARPKTQTNPGASFLFEIDAETSSGLKSLARENETTLNATLLTAFKIFLSRYTGLEDIIVGSPAAGRSQAEFENVVGYFVNSVVIRTQLTAQKTFNQCLKEVHSNVAQALAHQDYPFSLLVEKLQPGREVGQSPLFNVMFVLQKPHIFSDMDLSDFILGDRGNRITLGDLICESFPLTHKISQFDITLLLVESKDRIRASFRFNPELFEESTISSMAYHFRNLVESIVSNPTRKISEFSIFSESEKHRMIVELSAPKDTDSTDLCLPQLLEQTTRLFPDRVAVVAGDHSLTYRQLDKYANYISWEMEKAGIGPEGKVGLFTFRSVETMIGIWAIFKAGGVYVPIDPEMPEDRLDYIIKDSGVSLILTQRRLKDRLTDRKSHSIFLDDLVTEAKLRICTAPLNKTYPENMAYIIYTSGTTGLPKGVMVSHRALANHCVAMNLYYEYNENDRVLEFASLNFDASLEQLLTPLLAGAAVILRDEELWPVAVFHEIVQKFALTMINLPPAYWEEITREWAEFPAKVPSGNLRLVIIGGDVMPFESVSIWQKSVEMPLRLINAYGPTETTITSTAYEVPANFAQLSLTRRIPLGRPLPHRKLYILDSVYEPVPTKVFGEMYIGGSCLARGYLNRPDLTAESFIPDPYSKSAGQRVYKTGDLALFLGDGNVEFYGRKDHQVKIRGIRIELGEIESVLRQFPSIQEAVVGLYMIPPGGNQLVAFLVTKKNHTLDEKGLRTFLKKKFPEFMVPRLYVTLKQLPLSATGKIDRNALPDPGKIATTITSTSELPRSTFEKQVAKIISNILETEYISLYDNFFELGGHSLLATRLISKIREEFDVDIPLSGFFEDPTVAGVCAIITHRKAETVDEAKLDQLLTEVENLSDEDLLNLLKD